MTDKAPGHEGRFVYSFEVRGTLHGQNFKTEFFESYETVEALMAGLPALEGASLGAFQVMQKSLLGH